MTDSVGNKGEESTHHAAGQRKLSTKGESLYQILDLEKGASAEDVKKQYRKLALKYHPDKNPNNPDATEKFKEINNANKILQDESKKEIYDQYGSMGLYIAEQIGEENMRTYFALSSPWAKCLTLFCCLITGCCFGCCCCCFFCFGCCCGKCRPQPDDADFNINPEDLEEEDGINPKESSPSVVTQPPQSSASETATNIDPSTNEKVPLTSAQEHPDYNSNGEN